MIYDMILADACHLLGVTPEEVYANNRKAGAVRARSITWYVLSKHYGWSLTTIAQHARKHHTTVLHGIRSIEDGILLYADIRSVVAQIRGVNYAQLVHGL